MKRIVLALLVGSALITSCGSNKSFNKKRHSHRNWVKVGEYTDSEFAQKESVEKSTEAVVVAKVETPVLDKENTTQTEDVIVEKAIVEDLPETFTSAKVEAPQNKKIAKEQKAEPAIEYSTNDVQELSAPSEKESKKPVLKKKREKKNGGIMGLLEASTILLIILAILIPPLAVGLYEGITTRFWISLLLTLLFYLPGIIYALLIVTGTI